MDIPTGRVLPGLDVANFSARLERLGDDLWVWLDPTRGQTQQVNGRGQRVGPALRWPVTGSPEASLVVLPRGASRVVVYDGDGDPGHGGPVVVVDLAAMRVLGTVTPAVCPAGPGA